MMKTLATKSKQKRTLLIIVTVFFAVLALLYLNSYLQNKITMSLLCFAFMVLLMAFSGLQLIKLNAKPDVLAEYDAVNLYLHTGKQDITIAWTQLESAKRKGHKNRIGNVQYADIVFLTTEQTKYTLPDVDNPDDVIVTIQSILNKIDAK